MAFEVPTNIPATLTAGDTWTWSRSLADYPAPTWTLAYALRSSGLTPINITAAASGSDHLVTVVAATTAPYTAGTWYWQAYVTAGPERHLIEEGRVIVNPNFATATSALDPRSHVKKVLDACRSMIEGTATREERMIVVDGLQMQLRSMEEILALQSKYEQLYARETNAENIARGLGNRRRILTRFSRP